MTICFIANCVLGMVGLRHTNIPMFASDNTYTHTHSHAPCSCALSYTCNDVYATYSGLICVYCSTLRRLTIMMVIVFEFFLLRKRPTSLVVMSVITMIFGSLIGGWGDLQFDLWGYFMVLCNNLVTALNLVFIKKTLNETKLATDTFGVLYYNSLLSIPCLLLLSAASGELSAIPSFAHLHSVPFQLSFLISAIMSFLMNYSTFWCTEVNSALTTSVTGQVKNVLSSFVALSLFGTKSTPTLITGLCVGLVGSFMYAFAIHKKEQKSKAQVADIKLNVHTHTNHHAHPSPLPTSSVDTDGFVNTPLLKDERDLNSKMDRVENGMRSPAFNGTTNGAPNHSSHAAHAPLLQYPHTHTHSSSHPPSSPNPLHPYNNPQKAKPS